MALKEPIVQDCHGKAALRLIKPNISVRSLSSLQAANTGFELIDLFFFFSFDEVEVVDVPTEAVSCQLNGMSYGIRESL